MRSRLGRRRVRTPLFLQLEAAECGAACLGALLAHHGRWEPMERLREACGVGRDGTSAADIVRAGERYGLKVQGWRVEVEELAAKELPAILFWEFNHFVVLEGISRGRYLLNDPANGRRAVGAATFDRGFTGLLLTAEPAAEFEAGGERPSIIRHVRPWLRGNTGALAYAAAAGLLITAAGLALPLLAGWFTDATLGSGASAGFAVSAAAAAGVVVYLATLLQRRALRKLAIRLSVVESDRMMRHLLRLPLRYFAHRFAGDVAARPSLVDSVARRVAGGVVVVALELVTSLALLALMLVLDPVTGGIVAAIGALSVLIMIALRRLRTDENRRLRREQALVAATATSGLRNIDSLRAASRLDGLFARITGYQARELTARQRFMELGYVIAALPTLALLAGSIAVIAYGGTRLAAGAVTLGELLTLYLLAGNFLVPVGRFVQSADALEILEADFQRIDDVLAAPSAIDPPEPGDAGGTVGVATVAGRLRLAGRVEFRAVTFGFDADSPPLIRDFNLTLEPGRRVAVVGPTGSGKSTLLRLANGEYTPHSGEILFDGVPADRVPAAVMASSVATVDQEVVLFAATVRENLTMWNPATSTRDLLAAASDSLIHDEIMARAGGYEEPVIEGGRNFSGGQRQRMEICRALVNNPSVLFLDEATSSLDAVSEHLIDDAIRRRGCTCLIVAHRLSTIRDCDEIIVLDRGVQVQRGTHEELLAEESGIYRSLVLTGQGAAG